MFLNPKYRPYAIAICCAFIMTMLVAPEMMEGKSMCPTLKDGQLTVIVKQSYSAKQEKPERGKVVCLEKAYSLSASEDNIIGRVAGIPGDKITIKDGVIYRNDKKKIGEAPEAPDSTFKLKGNDVYLLTDNYTEANEEGYPQWGVIDMREIKGNVWAVIWPLSDIGVVE